MVAEIFGIDGLIVLLVIVVVLFGGAAIPKLARNLGTAQSEFKKGLAEGQKDLETKPSGTSSASQAVDEHRPVNPT